MPSRFSSKWAADRRQWLIALPGRAAIHAALHPEAGDAVFFVARGDGTHEFTATLAEHNRAVDRYQKKKRQAAYRSAPPAESE